MDEDHYPEYREAKAVELMTAALLNDLVNGAPRMLKAWNYLRCIEPNASAGRVCLGAFNAYGLKVVDARSEGAAYGDFGRALVRKS